MKLWYSFTKELKLSARGYYFYVEIFIALLLLAVLLFVVPEQFVNKSIEYVSLDLPDQAAASLLADALEEDLDGKVERVELKDKGEVITVDLYESDHTKMYLFADKETMIRLTEADRPKAGAHITLDNFGKMHYQYYLQGYESEKLKNLYLIFHNRDLDELEAIYDQQEVRSLGLNYDALSDRENVLPPVLTFNGSLMGLFIIAAYIFLDKQEGIIKAYAVTSSPVWHYLMSKVGVILVTSTISCLVIVMPIMGLQPNYPLLLLLLITSGFFASALGLVLASYYRNLMQSFGAIYVLIITLMIPNIAYFIPSWEPLWIKFIPSYTLIQGFKEAILPHGDYAYILTASISFLLGGLLLFLIANKRFKKTLAV